MTSASDSALVSASLAEVSDATEACMASAPLIGQALHSALAEIFQTLRRVDVRAIEPELASLLDSDARAAAQAVVALRADVSASRLALAQMHFQRLRATVSAAAAVPSAHSQSQSRDGSGVTSASRIKRVSSAGTSHGTLAAALGGLGLALVGLAIWLSWRSVDWATDRGGTLTLTQYVPRAAVSLVVLLIAVYALHLSRRYELAARDEKRIASQSAAFAEYLEKLPPRQRDLLRGTAAPLFFSRLLEDKDPIREVQWPTPDLQLAAIPNDTERPGQPDAD